MKERSRVEQFERTRRDHRDEGLPIRALADKYRVHRRTVRQTLANAVPPPRKTPERYAPVLGPYEATVRRWLIEEEGAVVAESSVRGLVDRLRVEIGADRQQVMLPQSHGPAEEAEVDFGEFTAVIAGVVVSLFMFCLRLSHSGKAVHVAYANQTQESFLDRHVRAFEALGGCLSG